VNAPDRPAPAPRLPFLPLAAGIVLLSTLLQIGALNGGAVIDDHLLLTSAAQRGCDTNPASCFLHPLFHQYYRPLMAATFAAGIGLHGALPFWFHLENLALHAGVVALALWAFRLLFCRAEPALLAGLLFGLHPLQVGVTTFIGGRTDSLALFCLFWYVIGLRGTGDEGGTGGGSGRIFWPLVSLLGFAAAVFTKEQCLPLVLLAPLLATRKPQADRRSRRWLLLYGVPVAVYLLAARRVLPAGVLGEAPWSGALHLEMVGRTLWYYAKVFLFPTARALDQDTLGPWEPSQPLVMLAGYVGGGLWLALLRHVWPNRLLRAFALWTTLTLLPCLNLVPIPSHLIASYRAALPLFGLAGLAGAALAGENEQEIGDREKRRGKRRVLTAVLPVCLAYAGVTLASVAGWRNDETFARAQRDADPNFLPAQARLAGILQGQGRYAEALAVYDDVLARLFPGTQTAEERIAQRGSAALQRRLQSQSGLRYDPAEFVNVTARGRGGTHHALGQWQEAAEDYRVALAFRPDDTEVAQALETVRRFLTNR
jgi:tetratricopeptide (TPR) repeat protein